MPFSAIQRSQLLRTNRAIALLLLGALLVLTFTLVGALLVFSNARAFLKANDWLEHSHTVLQELALDTGRIDRIGFNMQLFRATRDDDQYRAVLTTTVGLKTSALRLQRLVQDNPSELRHSGELLTAVEALSHAVDAAKRSAVVPETELRDLSWQVTVMQTEERALYEERVQASQRSMMRPLLWGGAYLGFSLLVWAVLCSILIQDAVRRRRFEERLSEANGNLATTVEALGARVTEATLLKNARDELQLCVTAEEAYACSARHLEQLFPGSGGAIAIINNSRSMVTTAASWNAPEGLVDGFEPEACCGLRTGRSRWRKLGASEIHCGHFVGVPPEGYICIPLAGLGETLGVVFVHLATAAASELAAQRMSLLHEMVELAAMAIAGLNLRSKLEQQSIRDGLTNLFNRHFMELALERELARASRRQTSLAVLMIDIDHFKSFNDHFGHEAGDLVLREVAGCLQTAVRSEDIVCRYGGEEFVVLLPEIAPEMALETAERLRERVAGLQLELRGERLRPTSISLGVATYPDAAYTAVDLLRMADQGLYQAKHAGRNQVQAVEG